MYQAPEKGIFPRDLALARTGLRQQYAPSPAADDQQQEGLPAIGRSRWAVCGVAVCPCQGSTVQLPAAPPAAAEHAEGQHCLPHRKPAARAGAIRLWLGHTCSPEASRAGCTSSIYRAKVAKLNQRPEVEVPEGYDGMQNIKQYLLQNKFFPLTDNFVSPWFLVSAPEQRQQHPC